MNAKSASSGVRDAIMLPSLNSDKNLFHVFSAPTRKVMSALQSVSIVDSSVCNAAKISGSSHGLLSRVPVPLEAS